MKNIHCMQKIISFLLVWSVCFQLHAARNSIQNSKILVFNGPLAAGITMTQYIIAKQIDSKPLSVTDYYCIAMSTYYLNNYACLKKMKDPFIQKISKTHGIIGLIPTALLLISRYVNQADSK